MKMSLYFKFNVFTSIIFHFKPDPLLKMWKCVNACVMFVPNKRESAFAFFPFLPVGIDRLGSWKSWLFSFLLRWPERPLGALRLVGIRSLKCWKLMQIVVALSVRLSDWEYLDCLTSLIASRKTELKHTPNRKVTTPTSGFLPQKQH